MVRGNSSSNRGRGRGSHSNSRASVDVRNSFASLDNNGEMNADISERFRGAPRHPNSHNALSSALEDGLDLTLNLDIRDYVSKQEQITSTSDADSWLSRPDIPTNEELSALAADLSPNKVDGPYKSKERYVRIQYELLREDAVGNLRDAIHDFLPDSSTGDTHKFSVYDQVHIMGFTFARRGLAARIKFSTNRAGKQIKWQNSKRLVSGSIVALIPAKSKVIDFNELVVAVVAARPLAGVLCEPPEIDLYFGRSEDIQLDTQKEWIMIEAKQGYFEAYRHTLRALQKLSQEKFPLSDDICRLTPAEEPPAYVQEKPVRDISAAATQPEQKKEYSKVDITQEWPSAPVDSLDNTQWEALKQILVKPLAIVQGPPGTGKTFVSRVAVEILHANRKADDPPIIIAAQTNHALDQLLSHVSLFEPNYIRLGGRSTKPEVKKRALFEVRQSERIKPIPGGLLGKSNSFLTKQTNGLVGLLDPFIFPGSDPWSTHEVSGPKMLHKLGVLSAQQAKSLEDGATQWVSATAALEGPINLWLGKALIPFEVKIMNENYGFEEVDDDDLEFEQLRENEDSNGINDEEDIEMLKGPWYQLHDRFTVQEPSAADLSKAEKLFDSAKDMWKIPDYYRAHVYHVIQSRAKAKITAQFREAAKVYEKLVKDNLVGKWEQDAVYLQRASVIGMTTTGLSKYRPLISALKPKIILIEEAAEVLEAPVTVACIETLEHLILVGDHQQLQGHCSVQELENEPFYLNVSLFERLVRNDMPYKTLLQQRRMMPEFRRLIGDLYPNLTDHQSVVDRQVEPWGMGQIKSFFFNHEWWEAKDASLSTFNPEEAKFIAGFFRYLCRNAIDPTRITVLTFYNGQRKRVLRELKEFAELHTYVNVKTVDSYQGEENDIVILSLARNNQENKIGFLENINRTCVALSRAKYGFYLFGNAEILMRNSPLWFTVLSLMESNPRRRGDVLPIMCKRHSRTTLMRYSEDWSKTDGGCMNPCGTTLQCGHPCPLQCHPYSHDVVQCALKCGKTLLCGHGCSNKCSETCLCSCEEFAKLKHAELVMEPRHMSQDIQEAQFNGQHLPNCGSASYLPQQDTIPDEGQWQVRPALDWGPSGEETASTDRRSTRTGYRVGGVWNPVPDMTVRAHSLSPAKQGQRRRQWQDFAQGGFVADDERLQLMARPAGRPSSDSGYGEQNYFQGSSIITEAVQVLADGRNRVVQAYQPGRARLQGTQKDGIISDWTPKIRGGGSPQSSMPERKLSPKKVTDIRVTQQSTGGWPIPSNTGNANENSALNDLKDLDDFFRTS
ncbi:hypothetical protein H2200_011488 [Cladophialophora chaetospira]|uniref:DEAD box helicase involved in nonsense mediated decay n=1 Tax=Cladophialophora chaetospira TaxID=386627 RepID=A0AA39CD71_9EURO|nr:hypothetical protein H2200_011488 [Cladophialophora chaetospira]